ncbi:MAG: LysE family translocator [Leptolyngbyaceae cyanobacterium SM1_1_3]|nr:LysE family translocator [Leptolyngbyaceae cyanobacterium SM1_1_3]NJN04375.1 LysE family translocator [Leptolyngbyaceae cyanobacterium RM1_1_2]NJO10815.1 LysE family translocator [Leptolyngbyaceae cyanobacterium SL_1_1]
MADPNSFPLFLSAVVAITVLPGPDTLYVLGRSLEQGRIAGIVSALGIFVGNLGHTAAAAVGLSAILMTSALAFNLVKYAGAAYLIYLGIKTLLSRDRSFLPPTVHRAGLLQVFGQAVLTNLLNPKAALFFLAFVPQFIDPASGQVALQTLQLGVIVAAASSLWLALISGLISSLRRFLNRSQRFVEIQRWVTGSLFVGLGLRLAVAETGDR